MPKEDQSLNLTFHTEITNISYSDLNLKKRRGKKGGKKEKKKEERIAF